MNTILGFIGFCTVTNWTFKLGKKVGELNESKRTKVKEVKRFFERKQNKERTEKVYSA